MSLKPTTSAKNPPDFQSLSLQEWGISSKKLDPSAEDFQSNAHAMGFMVSQNGEVLVRPLPSSSNKQTFEIFVRDTEKEGEDKWVKMTTTRAITSESYLHVLKQVNREALAIFKLNQNSESLSNILKTIGNNKGAIYTKTKVDATSREEISYIKNRFNKIQKGNEIASGLTGFSKIKHIASTFFSLKNSQEFAKNLTKEWAQQEAKREHDSIKKSAISMSEEFEKFLQSRAPQNPRESYQDWTKTPSSTGDFKMLAAELPLEKKIEQKEQEQKLIEKEMSTSVEELKSATEDSKEREIQEKIDALLAKKAKAQEELIQLQEAYKATKNPINPTED